MVGQMETLIDIDGVGKTFTGQDGEHVVALGDTDLAIGRGELFISWFNLTLGFNQMHGYHSY
tara:strand:- start:24 stop:209 length:186 start_codon:yes stop_codon:yes gene_type:complete